MSTDQLQDRLAHGNASAHWRPPVTRPEDIDMATLAEVMTYENQDVIDRYMVDNDATAQDAAQQFQDVKRWLWLCAEAKRERAQGREDVPDMNIFDDQLTLDEMWHTFILFTPAYIDFCFHYFGTFLHHSPTPERQKREYNAQSARVRHEGGQHKQSEIRALAAYVFDKLGEDVARRWYLQAQRRHDQTSNPVVPAVQLASV